MNKNYGMGALSPPGFEWEMGKTAATIRFVREAVAYMADKPKVSPIRMLEQYVERLKSGEEVLDKWLTVEQYMSSEHIRSLG